MIIDQETKIIWGRAEGPMSGIEATKIAKNCSMRLPTVLEIISTYRKKDLFHSPANKLLARFSKQNPKLVVCSLDEKKEVTVSEYLVSVGNYVRFIRNFETTQEITMTSNLQTLMENIRETPEYVEHIQTLIKSFR